MDFQKKTVELISNIKDLTCYMHYMRQFKSYLVRQGFPTCEVEGEKEWIKRWRKLSRYVDVYSYRFFSRYTDNPQGIVPENLTMRYIENLLNPLKYRKYFEDKNMYGRYIPKEWMPRTIVRRIGGGPILDGDYNILKNSVLKVGGGNAVILKPSVESNSGTGVMKFERINDRFVSIDEGIELTMEFLKSYGNDFILQEAVEQHSAISELCSTSLNTLRICLYRSVKDNASHVLACALRVAKDGNYLDNAHAGGRFIAVDIATGQLGMYVSDTYGSKSKMWNGIDYSIERRKIPCWEEIVKFAENIGGCHDQMRLISLDVALDKDSKPLLIEGNVTAASYWIFMLAGQSPFGDFTDEIIDYCAFHKDKRNFNVLQLI